MSDELLATGDVAKNLLDESPCTDMVALPMAPCLYKIAFTSEGVTYSLDKLRLKFKVPPSSVDDALKVIECWTKPVFYSSHTSNKVGTYRYSWTLGFDVSSIYVGMSLIVRPGKTNVEEGYVEANPNKLLDESLELIQRLISVGAKFTPVRYDLAIDYPIKRDTVRIVKDQRKYGCEISSSMTEYLGQRNKPGRVKVYDKTAESELDYDLTRVELTCDAEWSIDQVLKKLPAVFNYNNADFNNLNGITKAFAVSVQAHLAKGDTLEPWLNLCEVRMRQQIREAFKTQQVLEYDAGCIRQVMAEVERIATGSNLVVL